MHLFSNGESVDSVSLSHLGEIITSNQPQIGLPKFQRDAVWDTDRIELLWDTIIRGFPFGSFIVAKIANRDKEKIKPISISRIGQTKQINQHQKSDLSEIEYILLDGQQRTNAIAVGFIFSGNERLWIDLKKSNNSNQFLYDIYACNKAHPWGYRAKKSDIYKARDLLFENNEIQRPSDYELNLKDTWPVAASCPIPLDIIINWCKSKPNSEKKYLIENLPKIKLYELPGKIDEIKNSEELEQIKNSINNSLQYKVPFVLYDNHSDNYHDMGSLFTRLNRQGIQMTGEDIFFSSIKVEIPESHDLVWSIYSDNLIGKILSPSKIVHIGTRIVAHKEDIKTYLGAVDANVFNRLKNENKNFLPKFKYYLDEGILLNVFRKSRSLIEFNESENPAGFPIPVLQNIKDICWHTICVWIAVNLDKFNNHQITIENKNEILRYIFMEMFFVWRSQQWIKSRVFEMVTDTHEEIFPGRKIYELYRQNGYLSEQLPRDNNDEVYIPDPIEFNKLNKADLILNKRDLIIWAQRKWLKNWFPDYDPTIFVREDDKPYDYDHILPQSDGYYNSNFSNDTNYRKYLNCTGNLRAWPNGENRRDQNSQLIEKLGLNKNGQLPKDSSLRHKPCSFSNYSEIIESSYIHNIELWRNVQNEKSLENLERAVNDRMIKIYQDIYDAFNFSYWK